MTLPLKKSLQFGVQTIFRRTEPAVVPWLPDVEDAKTFLMGGPARDKKPRVARAAKAQSLFSAYYLRADCSVN